MKYIDSTPNESGAYQNVKCEPFPGCLPLTDGQADTLIQYNGFVTITQEPDEDIEGSSVTVTPNTEAWESWKAEQPPEPEPEPTAEDVTLDMLADHEERLCMLELTTTTV